jgi:acyl-CoA reductase-like NAD-dependent aldehyde dehydrogenase
MPRRLKSLRDLANPERAVTHTIGGRGEGSESSFEVINPSTAALLARCPDASADQLNRAVAAARAAFAEWSARPFAERRRYLHKFAARVRDYADDLAVVITREQGKPLSNSTREVAGTANSLEAMSNIKIKDQVLRNDGKNHISL